MKGFIDFIKEAEMCAGGFNIARSQMPQIEDQEDFISFLEERGVGSLFISLATSVIKPTQVNFDQSKVDSMKSGEIGSIIVSDDFYVLDGHHRYFAAVQSGNKTIGTYFVDAGINKLLKLAYEYLES